MSVLIAQLNSPKFKEREKATGELTALAEFAVPALHAALQKKSVPLEQRRRMESLLNRLENPGAIPACLRELRAVEVLERIGSAAARQLLETLATGDPDSPTDPRSPVGVSALAVNPLTRKWSS